MIVRDEGFELTNGSVLIATIPKVNGEYDLKTLSELAMALKRDYPDADDASVLLEPTIAYDQLIQVMDAIRSAEVPAAADSNVTGREAPAPLAAVRPTANAKPTRLALFTDIAIGDAP